MEDALALFGVLIGLGMTIALIVLPIVALVRSRRAIRQSEKNQANIQSLNSQIQNLRKQVEELQLQATQQAFLRGMSPAAGTPGVAAKPESPAPVPPVNPPAPASGPSVPPATPPRPASVVDGSHPPLHAGPEDGAPSKSSAQHTPPPIPSATSTLKAPTLPIAPPSFQTLGAKKPALHETAKRVWNIEEVLGTNWLNKLGVIFVVIGVAFLLVLEMRTLGPSGKVLIGYAVSAAFLGIGVFFERRERWRLLARAAVAGGWALLYFTTYALNHFDATRVLDSEPIDFLLLILVAGAMVAHSLRYDSRVVTGMAFLLAFSTINISRAGATGLIASAILALALVVIVAKKKWFDVEALAIVALYLNHWYWLRPIIEPMGAHHHTFPELGASTALLFGYWLLFRFSYLFRTIRNPEDEHVSTVAALLNTFLFHGLIKYQSVHPELAFYFLAGVGAVEFTLGQLPITKRRRTAFVILTTLGATLLVAAFPYRYSGNHLSVIWLAEAEILVLIGVFTREILFRRLGAIASVLVTAQMLIADTHHLGLLRDAGAADFSDLRRASVFLLGALVIFANASWIPRRWPGLIKSGLEEKLYRLQAYLAGLLLIAAAWAACPEPWLALGLSVLALGLAVLGARWKIDEWSILANAFALLAFLRIMFADFTVIEVAYVNRLEVLCVGLTAAALYTASRVIEFPPAPRNLRIPEIYTWIGTLIVSLLAWYQLWPTSVALAWAMVGLILFQFGLGRPSFSLRLQAYFLFFSGFFRIFFVNFNAETSPGLLSPRIYTAIPLAVVFYFVYSRLEDDRPSLAFDRRLGASEVHCLMGTITIAAAMRFELPPDWIAAAWSALVFCCVLIAWKWGRRIFLSQALVISLAVLFRTIFHNFYQRSYFPAPSFWWGGWATVGASLILLFVALIVGLRLKLPHPEGIEHQGLFKKASGAIHRNPAQILFFVFFILLTGLLFVELRVHGMTTVAWGIESVAVFLFALSVKERSFRLSALGLLLVCVVKIVAIDVWGLAARDRYLTFIALGVALLTVSFLYTRFKETLRAYL